MFRGGGRFFPDTVYFCKNENDWLSGGEKMIVIRSAIWTEYQVSRTDSVCEHCPCIYD